MCVGLTCVWGSRVREASCLRVGLGARLLHWSWRSCRERCLRGEGPRSQVPVGEAKAGRQVWGVHQREGVQNQPSPAPCLLSLKAPFIVVTTALGGCGSDPWGVGVWCPLDPYAGGVAESEASATGAEDLPSLLASAPGCGLGRCWVLSLTLALQYYSDCSSIARGNAAGDGVELEL